MATSADPRRRTMVSGLDHVLAPTPRVSSSAVDPSLTATYATAIPCSARPRGCSLFGSCRRLTCCTAARRLHVAVPLPYLRCGGCTLASPPYLGAEAARCCVATVPRCETASCCIAVAPCCGRCPLRRRCRTFAAESAHCFIATVPCCGGCTLLRRCRTSVARRTWSIAVGALLLGRTRHRRSRSPRNATVAVPPHNLQRNPCTPG